MDIQLVPQPVIEILYTLMKHNHDAFLVGGCVRDLYLKKSPKDWDITTNATPEELTLLFPDSFYDNAFGTVSVKTRSEEESLSIVQVTPYRGEGEYTDNRRPDTVIFGVNLSEDLSRRDFTINALAWNPIQNTLVDEWGGVADVRKGLIRAVGEASERFGEDALRMLRAIRFAASLGFDIEDTTLVAIKEKKALLRHISAERMRDEFTKMISSPRPEYAMQLLLNTGLLEIFLPEFIDSIGCEQGGIHKYDVWTHLLKSLGHAAQKETSIEIRLSTLFHDIGKPATRRSGVSRGTKKEWTFYGHEVVGAKMTKSILTRLKFSQHIIDTVTKLVRWHMFFSDTENITLSAVRRMIANVGKELIWDLMEVRICDRIGSGRPSEKPYRLRKYHAMIEEAMHDPVSVSMLKIGGNDLKNELGIEPGPSYGHILNALLEEVLENPKLNTKELLLERARDLNALPSEQLELLGEMGKKRKEAEEQELLQEIREKHRV